MGAISAAPLTELREGTDKWFLKWAELTLRKCKAGSRMSDLEWESFARREPRGARERLGPVGVINNRVGQWSKSD